MKKNNNVNRRKFLGATAGGLASIPMSNAFVQRALAADSNIKRLIVWYVPEGAAQQALWPANTGNLQINDNASVNNKNPQSRNSSIRGYVDASMASYCLQPLKKHINNFSLYSGFQNRGVTGQPHTSVVTSALTGGNPGEGSFDQVMGRRIKGASALDAIFMPVYGHHVHDKGSSNNFMSPARRIGGGTFGDPNWNPMSVYNQLFGNAGIPAPNTGGNAGTPDYGENTNTRLEILKSAETYLETVKCLGGDQARRKMEILLESYQNIEKDTQALIDAQTNTASSNSADLRFTIPNGWKNTAGNRVDRSKYWNQQKNFGSLVDIAINTTVAGLALDKTRVSLMQFSASGDNKGKVEGQHYRQVGIQGLEGDVQDHKLGHNATASLRRDQARVFRWYYSKLAYLIDRLKAIPDGDGTLFDCTLIVTASEYAMYNHRNWDMPYLVAGGDKLNFKKGQYQNASNGNNYRHAADFFLGVGQVLDPKMTKFGQSGNAYKL